MLYGAVAKILFSVVEAIVVYVVADKMRGGIGEKAVHKDSFRFAGAYYGAGGVDCRFIYLAVPAELREPDIVFGVNLCELTFRKRDFAIIAEAVGVNGQVAFRPAVFIQGIPIGVAEAAAYIIVFDSRPARVACAAVEDGWIFYAVQNTSEQA